MVEAETLHRQVDQYVYGPPPVRFTEADADQARAAGVLIEFPDAGDAPIVTDKAVYREIAKQAISRTVEELRVRAAAKAQSKRGGTGAKRARTPREELDVEHRANLREMTRQAHGVNLDLGAALLKDLAAVASDDMDVARFFALCGLRHKANYADCATMPTRGGAVLVGDPGNPARSGPACTTRRATGSTNSGGAHADASRLGARYARAAALSRHGDPCKCRLTLIPGAATVVTSELHVGSGPASL